MTPGDRHDRPRTHAINRPTGANDRPRINTALPSIRQLNREHAGFTSIVGGSSGRVGPDRSDIRNGTHDLSSHPDESLYDSSGGLALIANRSTLCDVGCFRDNLANEIRESARYQSCLPAGSKRSPEDPQSLAWRREWLRYRCVERSEGSQSVIQRDSQNPTSRLPVDQYDFPILGRDQNVFRSQFRRGKTRRVEQRNQSPQLFRER